MPPEPKKPIEEALEASARARRAEFGGDPKMPNPMRARLHDEIVRMSHPAESERRKSWSWGWWPRIAIGSAMAAVVVGASLTWWNPQRSGRNGFQLAMDRATEAKELNRLVIAAPSAQSAPATESPASSLSDNLLAAPVDQALADNNKIRTDENQALGSGKVASENASALQKFADVAIDEKDRLAAGASSTEQKPAAGKSERSSSETAQPMIADAGRASDKKAGPAANLPQQFSQRSGDQALRSENRRQYAADVLQNFQVEQNGRRIRVVDADGSTYTGEIEQLSKNDARNTQRQNFAAASRPAAAPPANEPAKESQPNEFYFRASGFNKRLKKSVVFEGNYIAPSNPEEKTSRPKAARATQPGNARIIGTANISGEAPVPVDAVAAAPK